MAGDLGDLENALKMEGKVHVVGETHCSAIVKLTPGNKALLTAQNTWSGYNTMLRILKKYSLGYHLTPSKVPVLQSEVESADKFIGLPHSFHCVKLYYTNQAVNKSKYYNKTKNNGNT